MTRPKQSAAEDLRELLRHTTRPIAQLERAAEELECVERCAAELREILGARPGESASEAARRVVDDLALWRKGAPERYHEMHGLLSRERDEARAQVETLTADLAQAKETEQSSWLRAEAAEKCRNVAEAEAARYRAALELLAAAAPKDSLETSDWEPKTIYRFTVETGRLARAALLAMDPHDIDAVDRAWADRQRTLWGAA